MQKAIFIGIDGVQLEKLAALGLLGEADTARLEFIDAHTGGKIGTETEQPTVSGPGWSTLLTGVWVDKHGITENNDQPVASGVESVFELVDANVDGAKIASIVNWSPINTGHFSDETGLDGSDAIVDIEAHGSDDATVTAQVVDMIATQAPDFTFVHLDEPDGAGHTFGFGDEYDAALVKAFNEVQQILDAVNARMAAHPEEDWLVIVSTDHGRDPTTGSGHGEQTASERQTFIAANKDLQNLGEAAPATSVVPTILDHLGIEYDRDAFASGSVLEGAGDPLPPQIEEIVSPVDDASFVAHDSDLVVRFSEAVQAGEGSIRLHDAATGDVAQTIDVNSEFVSFEGAVMTVALPEEMAPGAAYYVAIDDGAVTDLPSGEDGTVNAFAGISRSDIWNFQTDPAAALVTLFEEDFESLADDLGPLVSPSEGGGDGTDWTATMPAGWTQDNQTPVGGPAEFFGWTFLDYQSWVATSGDQGRSGFTNASGVVAVADPDEYDDIGDIDPDLFYSVLSTPAIDLAGVEAGTLRLSFDSSWAPEDAQVARLTASYDGGDPVEVLRYSSDPSDPDYKDAAYSEALVVDLQNPDGASSVVLNFEMKGGNDWWWAIDNLSVAGTMGGTGDNAAPVATDDSYETAASVPLTVAADAGVLANDADADGDALGASLVTGPEHGTLTLEADGAFSYAPEAGFAGEDAFTYEVSDGKGGTATATATLSVTGLPEIRGTDGNDRLVGTAAAELLDGGAGRDIYVGHGGGDILVLGDGDRDRFRDFDAAADRLDVSAWGVQSFEELMIFDRHGSNGKVLVDIRDAASGNLAKGQTDAELTADNFIFAPAADLEVLGASSGWESLFGRSGDDSIDGGEGLNKLFGQGGADTFVIGIGRGDKVADFAPGEDVLDLTSWGVAGFDELGIRETPSHIAIRSADRSQLVRLDTWETGLSAEDLDAGSFIFGDALIA